MESGRTALGLAVVEMAEFLKTISSWEGGKGRGLGGHADVVNSTPSLGSGEMRSVSVGCVGIGRGIQSSFPDGSGHDISSAKLVSGSPGKSKTPAYPGTGKDVDSLRPTRSSRLIESYKEWFEGQSGEALFSKREAGDAKLLTFPEHPMTLISAPAATNLTPVEHVSGMELSLPPNPPECDQHLGSLNADTASSSMTTPGVKNCEVLVISEYINPLESTPLSFDGEQSALNLAAAVLSPHASTFTAAFLPGVHHPQREPKIPTDPEPSLSLEPTLANILHHTFQLLSQRPGTFIGVMPALVSILNVNLREENDVEEIIDLLCFASINDENFRYNGARVCTHLANELQSFRFVEHLLDRCRREFDRGLDSIWFAGDWNLCGKVALFIGELMVQLQAEVGQPSEILVRFVVHLLDRLLCFDDEALLKCLVQLLKLTGARLNEIVHEDLSRIMAEIRQSVLLKASSRKSREQLLSVVELDARGWMKDEELSDDGDTEGGNSVPATTCTLLPPEEAKDVDSSSNDPKVMESASTVPQEPASDASNGNNELDDLVEDLTEDERTGLEIAHCYEQYLREIGEDEI